MPSMASADMASADFTDFTDFADLIGGFVPL
jgi:hypothetical protein